MYVTGNELAGDTVSIGAQFTAGLSPNAIMSANVLSGATATFNLATHAALNVAGSGANLTVNTAGNDTVTVSSAWGDKATVNIVGNDNATISASRGFATVNSAKWARVNGTIAAGYAGTVTVNGGAGSTFNNNGNSEIGGPGGRATVGTDVIGRGTFTVGYLGSLEFVKSVGPNQSVKTSGHLAIDQPGQFKAGVTLLGGPARIDLAGLAAADSYSFKNDLLNIWSHNTIIDTLRLTDQTQHGFVVEAPTASGSVTIAGIYDPTNVPAGLPIHSSTWSSAA